MSGPLNVDWVQKSKEWVKLGIKIETEGMRSSFAQFFDPDTEREPDTD